MHSNFELSTILLYQERYRKMKTFKIQKIPDISCENTFTLEQTKNLTFLRGNWTTA